MMTAGPRRSLTALRWGAAALAVAVAHGGLGWAAYNWRVGINEAAAGAPEQAIMIELAALSVAPEAPPEELPPAAEPVAPEPVAEPPPPEVEPELEPPPLLPEPVIEPPPPEPEPEPEPEPVKLPEPEIILPELPELPDPAAVLAPPPPEKPKLVETPKPRPKPKPRIVQKPKPKPQRQRAERAAAPPPAPQRASAPNPPAPGTAARSSVSSASWRGSLIAHLNRHKRFPSGATPGTVQVAFSIDRGGRVLSARLVRSSGDPALDQEAVAMIRRASPVPAPPASVGGAGAVALAVPIRYTR